MKFFADTKGSSAGDTLPERPRRQGERRTKAHNLSKILGRERRGADEGYLKFWEQIMG